MSKPLQSSTHEAMTPSTEQTQTTLESWASVVDGTVSSLARD